MKLPAFKLEEYFAQFEFSAPYMMGSSDPETHQMSEILQMADQECLSLWNNLALSYTETRGLPLLRQEISTLYQTVNPENLLVFSGAEEAIFISMQVLLKKGDQALVLTPCYQSLQQIPQALGAEVKEFPLEWKNDHWQFNLEKFKSAINANTKLVILNFPHNPTGFHPSQELFKSILDIIHQHQVYLFCDEVYRFSEYQEHNRLPNAVDVYDKALSLGVMSKSFGLAGLRLGWLAASDPNLIKEIAAYKNYTTLCNSAPSEILALIALRNKEQILQRNIGIAQTNLDRLDAFFKRYTPMFEWYRPQAGFINFPRLKLEIDIASFATKLRAQEGVLIVPGTLFDNHHNHFRLGFGRRNLPQALAGLERFIAQL